jgi:phosphohistidine phosphatase SixA
MLKKAIINRKINMKQFIYIRHGQRPGTQNDQAIKDAWESSERFKVNHFDEPLTELGLQESYETGKNLINHIQDPNTFAYLYSSPYTRCIQTAIQIAKGFKEVSGKELKIRVEYGLAENINYGKEYLPKIDNGEITEYIYHDFFFKDRDGNIKYNPFDDYLSYESHKKNFVNHLDLSHEPLFGIDDINKCNIKKEFMMQIKTAKRIVDAPESGIVVSHGWMQSFYSQYVLLNRNHISPVEVDALLQGSTELNFVVIYNQNQDGTWERSLKPQRII